MKAELFVHTNSQFAVEPLRLLLAELIGPELALDVYDLDGAAAVQNNVRIGVRYSRLLQAAIPPKLGLSVTVKELDWQGGRLYIRVYWPVYMYSAARTDYYAEGSVPFFPSQFDSFFPALAIRDRMVLVPFGQGQTLSNVHPGETVVSRGLNPDVGEVDFHDAQALRAAMDTVAKDVSGQLQQELMAWASFRPSGTSDLRAAARELDVDAALLTRMLKHRIEELRHAYERLECKLDKTQLPPKRWTRTVLTITNGYDQAMADVTVNVAGPVEILPSRISIDLPAGGEVTIPLSIKPTDEGEFPIEITLVQPRDAELTTWLRPHHIWLDAGQG